MTQKEKEEDARLLRRAKNDGWLEAALQEVAKDQRKLFYILDWQRTSWLALLGLDRESVVLVIGAGYGAATLSLARLFTQVYSVEASPARTEFTRIRMEQEKVSNAHLLQSSVHILPFSDQFFDLIVVDEVSEENVSGSGAVAEDLQGSVLSRLHQLLKDTGILVIGNGGRGDRRSGRGCFGAQKKCRKALSTSGFGKVDFLWPTPSLNEVYTLVPLGADNSLLQLHLRESLQLAPRFSAVWWRQGIKLLLARMGLSDLLTRQTFIIARKGPVASESESVLGEPLTAALQEYCGVRKHVAMLRTYALSGKNVLRVFEPNRGTPELILKSTTPEPGSYEMVEAECKNLRLAQDCLAKAGAASWTTPRVLGKFQIGATYYWAESVAPGLPLSALVSMQPRRRRLNFLCQELAACIEVSIELSSALKGQVGVRLLESSWPALSECLAALGSMVPDLQRVLEVARVNNCWMSRADGNCVQHGDFTIENILKLSGRKEMSVIDWGELVRGTPPLYDIFSLLVSAVPQLELDTEQTQESATLLEQQFLAAFFGKGRAAEFFRALVCAAAAKLSIPKTQVWEHFAYFLALRVRHFYLRMHSSVRKHPVFLHPMVRTHARFLLLALTQRDRFIVT